MLHQHEPLDIRTGLEGFSRGLGERQPGPNIGHDRHTAADHLGAKGGAIGLVDEAQHRDGMRVVDKAVRQEGVQQCLDRDVRRRGIEQRGPRQPYHLGIIE